MGNTSDVDQHLIEVQSLLVKLTSEPQKYDFQPPTLVSHANDYADQPDKLRKYAKQVISARIMIFLISTRFSTQALLQTYLLGIDAKNPFPMVLATRSQLELFSVVADTVRIIRDNSGEHSEHFATRVRAVDEALINATFGTRSPVLQKLMPEVVKSRLRPVTSDDHDVLKSKNILTRLERVKKSGVYRECIEDYERLCEYVHPNYGMNMLHVVASAINPKFLRLSLTSPEPFERAKSASVKVMARAAQLTIAPLDEIQPPFGMGTASRLN